MSNIKIEDFDMGMVSSVFWKLGGVEGAKLFLYDDIEVTEKVPDVSDFTKDRDDDTAIPPIKWEVVEHRTSNRCEWDESVLTLYISEMQKKLPYMAGDEEFGQLREELMYRSVLNVKAMIYLLRHPKNIPLDWEVKTVFFWGTIYRPCHPYKGLYVPFIKYDHERCEWQGGILPCDGTFAICSDYGAALLIEYPSY